MTDSKSKSLGDGYREFSRAAVDKAYEIDPRFGDRHEFAANVYAETVSDRAARRERERLYWEEFNRKYPK